MRKRVLLALMLVLALLVCTGCIKDEEADKQTVIVKMGDTTITKGEIQTETEYMLDYYEYMYSMYYGMAFDRTDANAISMAQQDAINSLIQTVVVERKIAEMGLDQFTEEELAEIETTVKEQYASYEEFVKGYALADTELTGDELQAAIDEQMSMLGFGSLEEMIELERDTRA